MVSEKSSYKLTVTLDLHWKQGNDYEAKVSVQTTDSCFHPVELKQGLPPDTVGIPETAYLTFTFTHDENKVCSDLVKTVEKTITISFSAEKTKVTAFAVVNGVTAGSATKDFPR